MLCIAYHNIAVEQEFLKQYQASLNSYAKAAQSALKFSEATNYVQQVGLSDMAAFSEDGTPAETTLMPFMLR